jgi:hypothetical protein
MGSISDGLVNAPLVVFDLNAVAFIVTGRNTPFPDEAKNAFVLLNDEQLLADKIR